MRYVAHVLLLVTAMAVMFPVQASSPVDERRQRIERRCAEEPAACEERKARHAERRARCEQNPEECEARRAERRQRHEEMRALCESNPEQCQAKRKEMRAKREACRDDPAACPKHRRQPSTN